MFTREGKHDADDAPDRCLVIPGKQHFARHADRLQHIGGNIDLPAPPMHRHKAKQAGHRLSHTGMAGYFRLCLRGIFVQYKAG